MTKVDFYIAPEADWEQSMKIACRVIDKAWRRRHNVYVHAADKPMMSAIDQLLWSFRSNSFIPHRLETTAASQSFTSPDVVIGCSGNPGEHHDVLINLTEQTPEFFSRFSRIAEIVRGDETAKAASRERYKYYRRRGYPLDVHQL